MNSCKHPRHAERYQIAPRQLGQRPDTDPMLFVSLAQSLVGVDVTFARDEVSLVRATNVTKAAAAALDRKKGEMSVMSHGYPSELRPRATELGGPRCLQRFADPFSREG
jgi:hypothetical protein